MAIVRSFDWKQLDRPSRHTEVEATIRTAVVDDEKFIQNRAMLGKVSQSLRMSEQAFEQLIKIGSKTSDAQTH